MKIVFMLLLKRDKTHTVLLPNTTVLLLISSGIKTILLQIFLNLEKKCSRSKGGFKLETWSKHLLPAIINSAKIALHQRCYNHPTLRVSLKYL